jgi:DNA-binding GntR family transcriptional regulator
MEYSEALVAKIDARIAELKTEIAAHERALAALRDGQKPRQPRRSRSASAEAVFDALNDGEDQASAIAKQFGVSAAVVRNRLEQLEEAGRVSRSGNRRSTRWRSHAA